MSLDPRFEIKKSTIQGAGKGLFARVELNPGDRVGDFVGLHMNEAELESSEYSDSDYLVWICHDYYIVCDEPHGNHTRFVNHDDSPNCEMIISSRWKTARLEVIERIEPGEELFIDYGPDYWGDHEDED